MSLIDALHVATVDLRDDPLVLQAFGVARMAAPVTVLDNHADPGRLLGDLVERCRACAQREVDAKLAEYAPSGDPVVVVTVVQPLRHL